MIEYYPYVTIQGDKWDGIANGFYGNTNMTDRLMAANPEHLHYYTFPVGITLKIPYLETEQKTVNALPPWRQVV